MYIKRKTLRRLAWAHGIVAFFALAPTGFLFDSRSPDRLHTFLAYEIIDQIVPTGQMIFGLWWAWCGILILAFWLLPLIARTFSWGWTRKAMY